MRLVFIRLLTTRLGRFASFAGWGTKLDAFSTDAIARMPVRYFEKHPAADGKASGPYQE